MRMERNATIYIRDEEDGEPIFVSESTVSRVGNSLNISYAMSGDAYVIGVSDGIVSISKKGKEEYALMLCEGNERSLDIGTPFGVMRMKVTPSLVHFAESEEDIDIKLIYDIFAGKDNSQTFKLFIRCKYRD